MEAASHFCSLSLCPAVPCFLSLACCLFSRRHSPPPHTHTICSLPTMCISLHISVRAFEPGLLRRWFPAAPDACCLFFPSPCSLWVRRAGLWAGSIALCPWYLLVCKSTGSVACLCIIINTVTCKRKQTQPPGLRQEAPKSKANPSGIVRLNIYRRESHIMALVYFQVK